jgi:hypothetical protein
VHLAFLRTGLLLALVTFVQNAVAQTTIGGAALVVKSPPSLASCVEPTALRLAIQNQLGPVVPSASRSTPLTFEVNVHQTRTQIVADLHFTGKSIGVRSFEAARCAGLKDAIAVTIAMILDEEAKENHGNSKETNAQKQEREPVPSIEDAPQEDAPERPLGNKEAKGKRLSPSESPPAQAFGLGPDRKLRAYVAGGYGTQSSYLFDVGAEFSYRQWAARLGASYEPTRRLALGEGSVDLMRMSGLFAACYRFTGSISFVPCLRTDVGAVRVKSNGFGLNDGRLLTTAFFGPSLGVESGKRWIFGLELIGQLAGWRERFVVEYLNEDAKTPQFVAWLIGRIALSS